MRPPALWATITLVAFAACKRAPVPSEPDASASAPTTTAATSSAPGAAGASAPVAAPDLDPRSALSAWNKAHDDHDAAALAKLYAQHVLLYGNATTGEGAAAQKAAAFAATPSYAQKISKISFEKTVDGRETWARFDKLDALKKKTFPMLVRFDASGHIVEESDDVTRDESWCFSGAPGERGPSDRVVPPFRISASGAIAAAMNSRHGKALQAKYPDAIVGSHGLTFGFGCAKRCAAPARPTMLPSDAGDCNFSFRFDDASATTASNLLEWVEVDPMTKTLLFEVFDRDGGMHMGSEALP